MDDGDDYTIRLFEHGDTAQFLELFESVFGEEGTEAWFEWKYVETPYVSHVPIHVAEHDGEIVGARPFMAFRLSANAGERTPLGLQTCDTMVHPDHRRKGLFTRMTTQAYDYYGAGSEEIVSFNVPNSISRPGYLKLGCEEVGEVTTYYRIQRPAALTDGGAMGVLARLGQPATAAYNALTRRRADVPDDVTVKRHESIPSALFADLYERNVPRRLHALRDERFYDWRFDNPRWEYTAYTAIDDDGPAAGVVVGEGIVGGGRTVQFTDVVPLVGDEARDRALAALIDQVLADYRHADLISAAGETIPADLLRSFGFRGDDELPLSKVTSPTVMIARTIEGRSDPTNRFDGFELSSPDSWRVTFAEQNTS